MSTGPTPNADGSGTIAPELERRIDREEKTLGRLLEMIRSVTTRVPPLCALALAMLGFLASRVESWTALSILLVVIGAAGPVACILFCVLATLPETKSSNTSLLFFGTIAAKSLDDYRQAVRGRTDDGYFDDLMCQVHRNAEIANGKHEHMKRSMYSLFVGMFFWLIAVYALINFPAPKTADSHSPSSARP